MTRAEYANGLLIAETDAGIARITLNNPARHNAMTGAMWRDLPVAMAEVAADPDMRVVILTGAGERAFCAGADISEFGEIRTTPEDVDAYDAQAHRAADSLMESRLPVIARIDGVCVGGGMELAMACDLPMASSSSRFGVTPSRLGLGYALKDCRILVDAIGTRGALELLLTGKIHDAQTAQRLGLIQHVYSREELDVVVDDYATTIAGNAPIAVNSCKQIIRALGSGNPVDEARCKALVDGCFASEDYKEGQKAFAEKRKPVFKGV